jgi:hypothetical protein
LVATAPVTSGDVPRNKASSAIGTVTISGLNFGTADPSAIASLTGANSCSSSSWTSATTVACAPFEYDGGVAVTVVSVSVLVGTVTGQLSFDGTSL